METKLEAPPKKKRGRPLGSKNKTKLEATPKEKRGRPLGSKNKTGLRTSTLQSNTDFGKLARMKAGDIELFFAPDGVAKKMRSSLGAYFVRLGGSHLFSQCAVYGVIPGNPAVVELVMVKRLPDVEAPDSLVL